MPHAKCSVCRHPELATIDVALKAGESLRGLAKRFGLNYQSIHRHQHEDDRAKTRVNTGQIARIDEEIAKLKRAQNRAKKKRDNDQVLAIAKELRNWFVLRQKAEVVEAATATNVDGDGEIPLRDAIGIAKGLIESQVGHDADLREWVRLLAERVSGVTGNLPEAQAEDIEK